MPVIRIFPSDLCYYMGFFSVRQEKSLCLNQQFILLKWKVYFLLWTISKADGHSQSAFATCSWTQSLCDLSVGAFNSHWHKHPPYPPLSALRTWSGGMLILRSTFLPIHLFRLKNAHSHMWVGVPIRINDQQNGLPQSAFVTCSWMQSLRNLHSLPTT